MTNDAAAAAFVDEPTASPPRKNGAPSAARGPFSRRAARVTGAISGFSTRLDDQVRRAPYPAMGVAGAIGLGVGILLGSRILRAVAASLAASALLELGRAYVRHASAIAHEAPTNE